MDPNPQQCQPFNQLDVHSQTDIFDDMPLSGEFLDGFGVDPFQDITPGGLPSPNFSNPDLPHSGQQSPTLPCVSTLGGRYDSQPSDRNLGADSDSLGSRLPQQSHEMRSNTASCHTNSQLDTDQSFLNSNYDCPKTRLQQGTPSTTSSSPTNGEQYLPFTAPSEGSLDFTNNSFQNYTGVEPSTDFFEHMVPFSRPTSTPMPVGPKFLNNTSFTSVSANLQHSPGIEAATISFTSTAKEFTLGLYSIHHLSLPAKCQRRCLLVVESTTAKSLTRQHPIVTIQTCSVHRIGHHRVDSQVHTTRTEDHQAHTTTSLFKRAV